MRLAFLFPSISLSLSLSLSPCLFLFLTLFSYSFLLRSQRMDCFVKSDTSRRDVGLNVSIFTSAHARRSRPAQQIALFVHCSALARTHVCILVYCFMYFCAPPAACVCIFMHGYAFVCIIPKWLLTITCAIIVLHRISARILCFFMPRVGFWGRGSDFSASGLTFLTRGQFWAVLGSRKRSFCGRIIL